MDWREDFEGGESFEELLRELIADERISGPMLGKAMKVLRGGVGALKSGEAFIFKRDLIDDYATVCKCCQERIPWNEVLAARMFNEGYCGYCANRMSRTG
jgi:hypothetical protein